MRVVALSRLATGLLPQATAAFRRRMPEVDLTIETHHRRDMERWLTGRQFDVGFGPLPIGEPSLDVVPMGALPAVAVFAAPGPFPADDEVEAPDLAPHPMIALTSDTLLQSQTEAIFAAAGGEPRIALRTSSSQVACLLAAEGLGYAVTDPITARALGLRVAVHRIRPPFTLTYGVLTPRDQPPSPAATAFAGAMREAMRRAMEDGAGSGQMADHAPGASNPSTFALEASAGPA